VRTRNGRRGFWLVVECAALGAALAVLVVLGFRLVSRVMVWYEETKALESIRIVMSAESLQNEQAQSAERAAAFSSLSAQNADFRGWVLFGEDHSMYVCQGVDNDFYMTHRFDGSKDAAGMIFMDAGCTPDSANTLLYGHNMKDGSRFGTLNRYIDPAFLEAHPLVCFQSDTGLERYRPVAVFYASTDPESADYFDFQHTDFGAKSDYRAYVEAARTRSVYDTGITVKDGEKLLTLVTCSSELDSGRLVVLCRALRKGELSNG